MYLTGPMSSRNQFGQLLTDMGLTGYGVEIGTHRGQFAKVLLARWHGKLSCIDPWSIPDGYEQQAEILKALGGSGNREDDYTQAKLILSRYCERVSLIRATSREAIKGFADNTLDFVYIDGDHNQQSVSFDVWSWWTKLKVGGILAGHDWYCPGEERGGWGKFIQPVVQSFALLHLIDIYLVVEECGLPWSFYMVKK